MHKLGCPQHSSPYGTCECAAIEQREHTAALEANTEALRQAAVRQEDARVGCVTQCDVPVTFDLNEKQFIVCLTEAGDLVVTVTGRKNRGMRIHPQSGNSVIIESKGKE